MLPPSRERPCASSPPFLPCHDVVEVWQAAFDAVPAGLEDTGTAIWAGPMHVLLDVCPSLPARTWPTADRSEETPDDDA